MLAQLFKAHALSTLLLGTSCILALLYSFWPFSEGLLRPLENYAPPPSRAALAEARGFFLADLQGKQNICQPERGAIKWPCGTLCHHAQLASTIPR